ncbi:MAG TPA: dipeptide/oligopeptide/nickel ABC transporter ATP-binding protein [Galbitalea sp.]
MTSAQALPPPEDSSRPIAVRADDLSIRYESLRAGTFHAVNGVSFEIPQGEILAVIGESGSGKSSLAKAVAGLAGVGGASPVISGGSLTVFGTSLRGMSQRKRDRLSIKIGYVPQDAGAALDSRLTVGENVAEPIYSRDPNFDQLQAGIAVATVIDAVRLPLTTMNSYPHELSRGQRQRVAIARALILEPQLLVADDPTAGIDATVRGTILDIIRDLHQDRSFSAMIVSHTISEVRRFSDRVAVMHKGFIVGIGGVDEVLDSPQHEYVEGLAKALHDLKIAEEMGVS